MGDLPIACTLSGSDLARRQADLRTGALAEAAVVESLPNGLRWRFTSSSEIVTRLARLIETERQCCRFLRFSLQTEPDLGIVTMDVTGPEGARDFLKTWLEAPESSTGVPR